jgi:hypothetical protein
MAITVTIGGNRGAVRLDKVKAAYHGNLASIVHNADLDNGMVVQLGDLATGQREVFQVKVPDDTSVQEDAIWLHATPELTIWPGQTITDFYLPAGQFGRAYHLEAGDIVTITTDMLTGTVDVGNYVNPKAGQLKLDVQASAPTTPTRFQGRVIELDTIYGKPAAVILVEKN